MKSIKLLYTSTLLIVYTILLYVYMYIYAHAQKNVGRVLGNEDEVVEMLRRGTMINLHVVDFAKMTFLEQIKVIDDNLFCIIETIMYMFCNQ